MYNDKEDKSMKKTNDTLYIDGSLYHLNDPSDTTFQFHHLYGLAFNKDDEESLIKDAFEAFDKYDIYWFDPRRSDDAFFDDSPLNSNSQDNVFNYFERGLTDYIIDILDVLLKHHVTIYRSTDSKHFGESGSMNMNLINMIFKSNVEQLTFKYLDSERGDNDNYDHLHLIYSDDHVKKVLEEIEIINIARKSDEKEDVFHALLDFFHSFVNYYFKLAYRGRRNKNYPIIKEIKDNYYPQIIYDRYKEVRKAAREIVNSILELKNKK